MNKMYKAEPTKDEQLAFLESKLRQAETNIKIFEPEYEEACRSMAQTRSQLDHLQFTRDNLKAVIATVAKT